MVQFLPPSSLKVSHSFSGVIFNLGDFEGELHRGNVAHLSKVLRDFAKGERRKGEGDLCTALCPRPDRGREFIFWEYPETPPGYLSARLEILADQWRVLTRVDFAPSDLRELADKLDALSE